MSVLFAIFEFTNVLVSTFGKGIGALSVPFVILEFTNVFDPIGKGKGALSVEVAILQFTNVFVPIGKGIGALAFLRIWTINSALFIEGFSIWRLSRFNILESFEDFWW